MKTRAFTLIELLVVIAVIAVLMAILMPSLRLAKQQAASSRCLSNTKNLALGWYMYMQDNDGRLMSCEDNAKDSNNKFVGWIAVPETEDGTLCQITQEDPEVTDEDEIRGIKKGLLFPYAKNSDLYHCPSASTKSLYDGSRVFVSYSMPACFNRDPKGDDSEQIKTYAAISQPATRYIFVETAETRNWNASHHFVLAAPEFTNLAKWGWWGPMAINHGNSSILGYCDGHSELRKWRDPYTLDRVDRLINTGGAQYGKDYPPADQQTDIEYMAKGWAFRDPILNEH